MYEVFLPRKKVGATFLLFTFFIIMIVWIIGQVNSPAINNVLEHGIVKYFMDESIFNVNAITIFSLTGAPEPEFLQFISIDLKNCVLGMIVPLGFVITLFSFIPNAIFVGNYLFNLSPQNIILSVYYFYIYALSIDTGFYVTLYVLKREKQKLKSEITLLLDRLGVLIVLIITFEFLWWCFT